MGKGQPWGRACIGLWAILLEMGAALEFQSSSTHKSTDSIHTYRYVGSLHLPLQCVELNLSGVIFTSSFYIILHDPSFCPEVSSIITSGLYRGTADYFLLPGELVWACLKSTIEGFYGLHLKPEDWTLQRWELPIRCLWITERWIHRII